MAQYREKRTGPIRFGDPLLCSRCAGLLRSELDALDALITVILRKADGHKSSTGSDAAIRAHRGGSSLRSPSPSSTSPPS